MTQHSDKAIGLRHCFVEHTGNVWRVDTLIKAADVLDTFRLHLSRISTGHLIAWHMSNVHDVLNHLTRIRNANLSVPIILRVDGKVMNGWHRIIRAMYEGKRYILAKQFVANPQPDFILPGDHPAVARV